MVYARSKPILRKQNPFSTSKVGLSCSIKSSVSSLCYFCSSQTTTPPLLKISGYSESNEPGQSIHSCHCEKNSASSSVKEKEHLASVSTGSETEKGLPQTTAVTKEEKKDDTGTSTKQKKAEPIYFADSFNPKPVVTKTEKGSWRIKAEVSPMFAPLTSGANSASKSMSTVSGGMIASYQLNKRISISTGVRYSQMKQGTHSAYSLSAKSGITYLEPVEKSGNISRMFPFTSLLYRVSSIQTV